MEKLTFTYFLSLIFILFSSCERHKNDDFIKIQDEINSAKITKFEMNRGDITLNNNYTLLSNSYLIYENNFPKWIKDHNNPEFKSDDYLFKPYISDIDVPYILFKKKNEDVFYVVKYGDTLKFKLGDFW